MQLLLKSREMEKNEILKKINNPELKSAVEIYFSNKIKPFLEMRDFILSQIQTMKKEGMIIEKDIQSMKKFGLNEKDIANLLTLIFSIEHREPVGIIVGKEDKWSKISEVLPPNERKEFLTFFSALVAHTKSEEKVKKSKSVNDGRGYFQVNFTTFLYCLRKEKFAEFLQPLFEKHKLTYDLNKLNTIIFYVEKGKSLPKSFKSYLKKLKEGVFDEVSQSKEKDCKLAIVYIFGMMGELLTSQEKEKAKKEEEIKRIEEMRSLSKEDKLLILARCYQSGVGAFKFELSRNKGVPIKSVLKNIFTYYTFIGTNKIEEGKKDIEEGENLIKIGKMKNNKDLIKKGIEKIEEGKKKIKKGIKIKKKKIDKITENYVKYADAYIKYILKGL